MEIMVDKSAISDLITDYNNLAKQGKLGQFTEADVGSKFILPLIKALGWDIRNIDEVKEQKTTLSGPADYLLMLKTIPKIVFEIKKFGEDLDGKRVVRGKEESYPFQVTRYAWNLKVDWCVLTNFRELRLYYAHTKKPEDGLVFTLKFNRYLNSGFDDLCLISKESVVSGKLDTYEKRRSRVDIDKRILEDLFNCRSKLAKSILENNKGLTLVELKASIQKIIDRLIVIRVAEDRGIIGADSLWNELESWRNRGLPTPFMRSLKMIFREFDEIYNGALFAKHICEDLKLDNDVLEFIISDNALYGYNFDLIDADILGSIYENYLGHILKFEKNEINIIENHLSRKKEGIYYTPTYIVEFILRNTLGEMLKKCTTPEEVSKIRVLDPACGSGAFLIKAFDLINEWYANYNERMISKSRGTFESKNIPDTENKIIRENIYGVDLDPQASEIASVNLILKALKKGGPRLPLITGENIKRGNSLIIGHENDLTPFFKDEWKDKNPFNWQEEFPKIFAEGGFDIIIGNPPHGAAMSGRDRKYYADKYEISKGYKNTASLFIESAYRILKQDGYLGFVIPKSLTFSQKWKVVRDYLTENVQLITLADVSKAFKKVLLEQIVVISRKNNEEVISYQGIKLYWDEPIEAYDIPMSIVMEMDCFLIHIDNASRNIFEKIIKKATNFSCVSKTFRGLPIQSKTVNEPMANCEPILRGKNIQRYAVTSPNTFVDSNEIKETKKINDLRRNKIISQRIVAHVLYPKDHIIIMSMLDTEGMLNVDTVENTILTDEEYNLKYLLATLNSSLTSWFTYFFIYNKAIRTMDFDDYYVGKIPIYPASKKEQKELAEYTDELIKLTKASNQIIDVFARYLPPMEDQLILKDDYDKLGIIDTKLLKGLERGTIKKVHVTENNEWLEISADYFRKEKRGSKTIQKFHNIPILKFRIENDAMRKYLFHTILNNKKNLGTGNISQKILEIPVIRFSKNDETNLKTIETIMEEYLKNLELKEILNRKIIELNGKINHKIYGFYDLNEEEIAIIERPLGNQ